MLRFGFLFLFRVFVADASFRTKEPRFRLSCQSRAAMLDIFRENGDGGGEDDDNKYSVYMRVYVCESVRGLRKYRNSQVSSGSL
jgi:hypothetical protein